jgi:adenosylcobinamide-phosphate synthase
MTASTSVPRPLGAAAGLVFDRLFAEPSTSWHPLVHFGRIMNEFEATGFRDQRQAGVIHAVFGTALGVSAGTMIRSTALATGLAVGGRSLCEAAGHVSAALTRGEIDAARGLLPTLVGRDPSRLDEAGIARAAVESVAENTVDAVVAPALFGALAGAPGALGYRAINTMDAMVGHKSPRYLHYGWASARLDDVANWAPARCTAALVSMVRPSKVREIHRAVTVQAPRHPSPNAGVAEAAFAAALGLQLGGTNDYGDRVEERAPLGSGRPAESEDIVKAIRLCRDVTVALAAILGTVGLSQWWSRR